MSSIGSLRRPEIGNFFAVAFRFQDVDIHASQSLLQARDREISQNPPELECFA